MDSRSAPIFPSMSTPKRPFSHFFSLPRGRPPNPQNTTIYAFPFRNSLIYKGKTPKNYYMCYMTIISKL